MEADNRQKAEVSQLTLLGTKTDELVKNQIQQEAVSHFLSWDVYLLGRRRIYGKEAVHLLKHIWLHLKYKHLKVTEERENDFYEIVVSWQCG